MGRAIEKNYTCPICGKKSLEVYNNGSADK